MTATWPAGLIDALAIGIVLLDDQGRILAFNQNAKELTAGALREGDGLFDRLDTLDGADDAKARFLEGAEAIVFPNVLQVPPEDEENVKFFVQVRAFAESGRRFGVAIIESTTVAFGIRKAKHDLNNSLFGLLGYAELLKNQPDLSEPASKKVELILGEVDTMQGRIEGLGGFLRKIAKQ
ncbi:MAG: hypothetical protein R3344_02775 [Acidobacteriota bacterium]|nr:hypothetical protein [Acidobacteriota bacterium]